MVLLVGEVMGRFDGDWSHVHLAYMLSIYPLRSTFGLSLLPTIKSSLYSHHRPHIATPLTRAHHRPCFILPPNSTIKPRLLTSSLTSFYSTIVTNDFIPLSSLHHHDTFMTSWLGLLFRTFMDTFQTHLWCPYRIYSSHMFHIHPHHWSLTPVSYWSLIYQFQPLPFCFWYLLPF